VLTTMERASIATGDALDGLSLPDPAGGEVKLTVYGGRSPRAGREPGYGLAVDALHASGATGATVLLGVDGTLHGERRRARFFARNAGVPVMLLAIGGPAAIDAALPRVISLIEAPVVTIERVQVCKSAGRLLAPPLAVPDHDTDGLPVWQQVTVYCEERDQHDRRPLPVQLVRELAEAGGAGVTMLRGIRGFYGDGEPFAERLLSIRRGGAVMVIAIDTPTNVRRWWPVVDEVTAESGLVTSELVPASHGLRPGTSVARLASPLS
jgi:PII-like signaling protein